tara:strand:- start:294 stop:1460 length:1167 start_codon:yes stop_codon:yes gene_type:complete
MPSHIPKYGNIFEFGENDVFRNTIKTHPKVNYYIYNNKKYFNNQAKDNTNSQTPDGHVNLYELNVNRDNVSGSGDSQTIFPFLTKNGSFSSFSTVATTDFNLDFAFGDTLNGSYPLTSSIVIDRYGATLSTAKKRVLYALKNSLNFYTVLSPDFAYSSSLGQIEDKKLNIISVPSIFYGSSMKKGSVRLKYYVSGTLLAEASDNLRNGILYQTSGSTTGSSVGFVLYNEGFIVLTASSGLSTHLEAYDTTSTQYSASWHYFGTTNAISGAQSSSFSLDFEGEQHIQTLTMFAHAKENQLNFSNNPTFLKDSVSAYSSSQIYYEDAEMEIKNIVTSSFKNHSASFQPVTYISKVGIYDENKNLIAVASLANPVRKLENRSYTFKLKLDI